MRPSNWFGCVKWVTSETNCTVEEAIDALESEEWSIFDAIIDVRANQKEQKNES